VNVYLPKQGSAPNIPPIFVLRRSLCMRASLNEKRPSWGRDLRNSPKVFG
jgi:hypothetical protein